MKTATKSIKWETTKGDSELDLQKLLDAPDGDFGHDVFGIRRHINRQTGELENCFLPRCARN